MKKVFGILFILLTMFSLASCNDVNDLLGNDDDEKLLVVPTEIEELEFEDMTFVYDGTPKSLPELVLPKGYKARYYDNEQTEVGEYTVKVRITNSDGETVVTLKAKLTIIENEEDEPISKDEVKKIKFESQVFTYDGTLKSIEVSYLPKDCYVKYTNNEQTEIGTYNAKAEVYSKNGDLLVKLNATLTIVPHFELSDLKFDNANFDYDGTVKSIYVKNLPEGYSVNYVNNDQVEVGKYLVFAEIYDINGNFVGSLSAYITINESELKNTSSMYIVGGYYDDWTTYTSENEMYEISLSDLKRDYQDMYNNLETYDIKSIYIIKGREFNYNGRWSTSVFNNWIETQYDCGYTLKITKVNYDSYSNAYNNELWIPDPYIAHVGNLTPNALYIPGWTEINNGFGTWMDCPVVMSGSGHYDVVLVEYNRISTETQTGYALGAVKNGATNLEPINLMNYALALDPEQVNLSFVNNTLEIGYNSSKHEWSAVVFDVPSGIDGYNYLNYSFEFDHPIILKFEGNFDVKEQWLYESCTNAVDLNSYSDEFLSNVRRIVLFPAAGQTGVTGKLVVKNLTLSDEIMLEPEALYTTISELANNPPVEKYKDLYIVEGYWRNKDGMNPEANTYGNGHLKDEYGNEIIIYGFSSSSAVVSYDYATSQFTYKNDKSYLGMGLNDGAYVKVAMLYSPQYGNYSIYLMEIISNGEEQPPQEYPEPGTIETTISYLLNNKPAGEKEQIYIVTGTWATKDGIDPANNTYGRGNLHDENGNIIVVYSLGSSKEACVTFVDGAYKYTYTKDFLSLNITDGTVVKLGMLYTPKYDNYYTYLIEVIGEGEPLPEPTPEPTPEPEIVRYPLEEVYLDLFNKAVSNNDSVYVRRFKKLTFTYDEYNYQASYVSIPVYGDINLYNKLSYDITSSVEGSRITIDLVFENGYIYSHSTLVEVGSLNDLPYVNEKLIEIRLYVEYDGSFTSLDLTFNVLKFEKNIVLADNVYEANSLYDGSKIILAYQNFIMSDIKFYTETYEKIIFNSFDAEVIDLYNETSYLTVYAVNDYWYLVTSDGKYVSYGNNGNYLALLDSPNETSLWDITFDLFSAKISNVSIPERCIQYNISSPRFSCYKGTQYNPKIYIIG